MISVTCPVCQQPMQGQSIAEWPQFPFCSQRCKLVDLGRWLDGSYRLPVEETEASSPPEAEDTP